MTKRRPKDEEEASPSPYDLGALAEDRVLRGHRPARGGDGYELTLDRRIRHKEKDIADAGKGATP